MSGDGDKVELKRGLKNVYIDRTETTFIDGKGGQLRYRGYSIHDLAEHSTFEETTYLLLHGSLPTRDQLDEFDAELKSNRAVPDEVLQILSLIKDSHPTDVLRTAISAVGSIDGDGTDLSREATLRKGVRLTAMAPALVAAHARLRQGDQPVLPNGDLGHAANFLYMLFGAEPAPDDARLVDKDMVLHAEHGVNASTFAARIAASTRGDLYTALTAGMAVLKGPLHGGAAEGVMRMAHDIGSEDNAESYVTDVLSNGGRIMGIGHAVYRPGVDPRSLHLKAEAKALGERKGQPKWFSILEAVTETRALKRRARHGLNPNVDFWAGAVYSLLGITDDLFIPLFAMGRIPGWTMHVLEQYENNVLLRPRLLYVGPQEQEYVPVDRRG